MTSKKQSVSKAWTSRFSRLRYRKGSLRKSKDKTLRKRKEKNLEVDVEK